MVTATIFRLPRSLQQWNHPQVVSHYRRHRRHHHRRPPPRSPNPLERLEFLLSTNQPFES